MTVSPKPRALDWFALANAGMHPVKVMILEHLAESGNAPTSPNDFAAAFGKALGVVSYHVRQLANVEVFDPPLLVLERTEPRRGALQHFYVAADEALLSPRQVSYRALARSASRLAGSEVELTPESLAVAMQAAAVRVAKRGEVVVPWPELDSETQGRLRRVSSELLRGVAGA